MIGRGFPCSASHAVPFQKELEAAWGVQVFDRFTVVLHIFRCNARTKEARLQVALAELPLLRCWHSVGCLHSQLGLLPVFLGPTVAGAWDPQGVAGPTPWTAELVGHPMGLVPAWERHPVWDPVSQTAKGGPQPTSHLRSGHTQRATLTRAVWRSCPSPRTGLCIFFHPQSYPVPTTGRT